MKRILLILGLVLGSVSYVNAGCIGPVIMGKCQGQVVPWDTHPYPKDRTPQAPPGFYWDKRNTEIQRKHPEYINPFTGGDAHDSDWFDNDSHK